MVRRRRSPHRVYCGAGGTHLTDVARLRQQDGTGARKQLHAAHHRLGGVDELRPAAQGQGGGRRRLAHQQLTTLHHQHLDRHRHRLQRLRRLRRLRQRDEGDAAQRAVVDAGRRRRVAGEDGGDGGRGGGARVRGHRLRHAARPAATQTTTYGCDRSTQHRRRNATCLAYIYCRESINIRCNVPNTVTK